MPHLHLEYTANLPDIAPDKLLLRLNHALMASGEFAHEVDIKARATRLETFRIGTSPAERGFVFIRLAILAGRSAETKKRLSASLMEVLGEAGPWPAGLDVQLGVEIADMDRDSYGKVRVAG